MTQKLFEAVKRQRLAWSCAIIVGLFLTVYGHAPVLPVAAGCILAIGFAVLRAWPGAAARGK
jgi:hypothetical protein